MLSGSQSLVFRYVLSFTMSTKIFTKTFYQLNRQANIQEYRITKTLKTAIRVSTYIQKNK